MNRKKSDIRLASEISSCGNNRYAQGKEFTSAA